MLESKVNYEDDNSEDQRSNEHETCRCLQLVPCRPGDLLRQFSPRLLKIVNDQIVTFDILGRGSRIRTHIDGFGDR